MCAAFFWQSGQHFSTFGCRARLDMEWPESPRICVCLTESPRICVCLPESPRICVCLREPGGGERLRPRGGRRSFARPVLLPQPTTTTITCRPFAPPFTDLPLPFSLAFHGCGFTMNTCPPSHRLSLTCHPPPFRCLSTLVRTQGPSSPLPFLTAVSHSQLPTAVSHSSRGPCARATGPVRLGSMDDDL